MKNVIKRIFIIVFAVLLFSITDCKNFMSNSDDMIDKMAEEIKNSTAPELNVFVQAISGQGNAYSSTQTVKLDIKFQITFEPDSSYGYFTGWKAYSSYNTPDQKELTEKDIKFEDASALKTDVTIYKEYKEIRILPTC